MNDYLKEELFRKMLAAHKLKTQYRFNLDIDETGFILTVWVNHSKKCVGASYEIVNFRPFMQNDPKAEEKALNYAIAELNYFIKYPELKTGIRLAMYQEMQRKCQALNKDTGWIADYLNLDAEVMRNVETA